jgi:hypothetical protein
MLRFGFIICILEDKVILRFGDFERTSYILNFGDFERTGFLSSDLENWIKLHKINIVSLVY